MILWNFGFYINFIYEINKKILLKGVDGGGGGGRFQLVWLSRMMQSFKCSFQKEYEYLKYISIFCSTSLEVYPCAPHTLF